MLRIVDFYGTNTDDFASLAGPGRWNDPDMLIIGNFGLSLEQVICITWLSLTSLNWSKYAHYRAESWTGNNDDHHQSHDFYQRVMTIQHQPLFSSFGFIIMFFCSVESSNGDVVYVGGSSHNVQWPSHIEVDTSDINVNWLWRGHNRYWLTSAVVLIVT